MSLSVLVCRDFKQKDKLLFITKRVTEEFKSTHAEKNVQRKTESVATNRRIQSDLERNFRSLTEFIPKIYVQSSNNVKPS